MPAMIRRFRCHARAFVVALSMVIVTLGCGGERREDHVKQTLARTDRAVLFREAERVWKQRRSNWSEELPAGEWPEVFRTFRPQKVMIDRTGVFVCTHSFFVREEGLFVALDPAFRPRETASSYEHFGGVFYWYDMND